MRVIETNAEMARACREAARPLGLVPTMGALHDGHLALVRRGRQENATLVVTIFVNPTQFGPQEDLVKYPRDLAVDLKLLRQEQADLVFVPSVNEIYPTGFDTWVQVGTLSDLLEGEKRSGHFKGVATVVTKLLNLVRPDRAYFGQKDGQQTVVVRRLVRDLDLGVDIVVVPTVREPDGLAMSTRNVYLSQEERRAAPVVYRAISRAEELWGEGIGDGDQLRQGVMEVLKVEPLVTSIDYVSVADADTLEELQIVDARAMVSVAVQFGNTRLIDSLVLE